MARNVSMHSLWAVVHTWFGDLRLAHHCPKCRIWVYGSKWSFSACAACEQSRGLCDRFDVQFHDSLCSHNYVIRLRSKRNTLIVFLDCLRLKVTPCMHEFTTTFLVAPKSVQVSNRSTSKEKALWNRILSSSQVESLFLWIKVKVCSNPLDWKSEVAHQYRSFAPVSVAWSD